MVKVRLSLLRHNCGASSHPVVVDRVVMASCRQHGHASMRTAHDVRSWRVRDGQCWGAKAHAWLKSQTASECECSLHVLHEKCFVSTTKVLHKTGTCKPSPFTRLQANIEPDYFYLKFVMQLQLFNSTYVLFTESTYLLHLQKKGLQCSTI